VAFDDDEAVAKAFALADNRTSELGAFDLAALAAMAVDVHAADPGLLEAASFTEADLNALLAGQRVPPKLNDPDDVPEPPGEPVTQPGDLWLLGPHRLLCGDCRQFGDVERLLDGQLVNLAFTSPPYASQRAYDESSGFQPVSPDEYVDWFEDVQASVRAVLAEDGSWFVNIKEHCDDGQRHLYVKDLTIAHVRRWGWRFVDEFCWARNSVPGGWNNRFKNAWEPVFHFCAQQEIKFRPDAVAVETDAAFTYSPDNPKSKTGFFSNRGRPDLAQPGMARPSNVLKIGAETRQTENHAAPFPVALPAWFLCAYTDPGDSVLDPFMGSGSTLIAAHRESRVAYGVEISPAYCDVICRRFQEHTGAKPVLEASGVPHDFTA
jgi:site-specific DNA-methyltransferase (adenine-specific)/site-specific DNA-methyltransferase (cytosine-N4-specific)